MKIELDLPAIKTIEDLTDLRVDLLCASSVYTASTTDHEIDRQIVSSLRALSDSLTKIIAVETEANNNAS